VSKRCGRCASFERMKTLPLPVHNKPHTKAAKLKMSKKLKGRNLWHGRKRNFPTGKKHHNWNGGKSSLADKLRKGLRYKKWRDKVFKRDNYTCQECGKRGGKIEAHHKKEFVLILYDNKIITQDEAYLCQELWDINNGETLCCDCHNITKRGNSYEKL